MKEYTVIYEWGNRNCLRNLATFGEITATQ